VHDSQWNSRVWYSARSEFYACTLWLGVAYDLSEYRCIDAIIINKFLSSWHKPNVSHAVVHLFVELNHVLICHCGHTMGTCVTQWFITLVSRLNCLGSSTGWSLCHVLDKTLTITLTVLLSTREYKWVLANCQGNLMKCWGIITCDRLASHPGRVAIFLVASCYGNQNKLWQLCL